MSITEILKDIPVSDEAALLGAIAAAMGYFFGGFFGFIKLPFTRRERNAVAAVNEASAMDIMAGQVIESNKQVLESNRHIVTLMERNDAEREMYRQQRQKSDDEHRLQIKALEKSLIESQEQIKDLTERIENLQKIQDELKRDNQLKEKLIEQQEKRITTLEESEKQAHRLVIEKDIKITELEKRVKELEAEIIQLKALQIPVVIATTETELIGKLVTETTGATDEPLTDREAIQAAVASINSDPAIVEPPVNAGETSADVVPMSTGDGV